MPRTIEQRLLFKYVGGELMPLSRVFKTRKEAEKAREKYPERLRVPIGSESFERGKGAAEPFELERILDQFSARFST